MTPEQEIKQLRAALAEAAGDIVTLKAQVAGDIPGGRLEVPESEAREAHPLRDRLDEKVPEPA